MRFTPNSILSITVVSVLPLCAIGAQGQVIMPQPADSAATEMLHEVTVTGSRHSGEVVRPQTLRDGYLATLNAHSVADAVRYFAGVQLKDYGGVGGIKTLDIRSMGTNHMGVFYDGLPVGNAQNGQVDLGRFSLDNIEEIALYNGQESTIFQPARDFASSGSIYIRSRRPRFPSGRNTAGTVVFRTGSFGLLNPSLRIDRRISRQVSATFNVEYTYSTGRYRFRYSKYLPDGRIAWDTTAVRRNGDIRALRAEASVFGNVDKGSWMAKAYYYNSERGIPGAIVNNVWKNSQRQWDRNFFVQGRFRREYGGNVEIMVNGKYARDHMRYLNPDTTLMLIDNTFDQNELYLSATARYSPFRFWDIAVAADWQYNTLDSDMALFVFPSRHQLLGSVATALNFGGLRLRASLLANSIHDRTRPSSSAGSRRHFLKFTPAVFVAWIPQKSILPEVRCYWKKAFRMPTFNDLYYTDIGNASLDPETCTQFDIGATWRVENIATLLAMLEFSADAYYNHIVDKIIAVPKGNGQYRWMMMNLGLVKIRGVDLGITTMLNLPAGITGRMRLTYTWQSALDYSDPTDCRDDAGTYKGQIAYIPRHAAAVAAGLQWHGVDINYSWIYTGQRWDNSSNIPENHIQPWYTSDISAAYSFGLGNTMLRISLEINNLADQQYEVIRNYPMPGRNYKVIAQWNF